MSGAGRDAGPSHSEDDPAREHVIRRPDDADAPAIGVEETDDPIPEPNEPA